MQESWLETFTGAAATALQPRGTAKISTVSTNIVENVGQSPVSPSSPTLRSPLRRHFGTSTLPFRLVLGKIEQLLLPPAVTNEYLQDADNFLGLQLRVSLFDADTGSFYGSTFKSRAIIDLRAVAELQEQNAAESGRRQASPTQDANDSDSSCSDEPAAQRRASYHPKTMQVTPEDVAARLMTRRLSVPLEQLRWQERSLYMHTSLCSPWTVAVVEYVFVVDPMPPQSSGAATERELIAGGWSLFWPFNPARAGLDVAAVLSRLDVAPDTANDGVSSQTVEVFNGTPRALVLTAPLLRGALQGYPFLAPAVGASLELRFEVDVGGQLANWLFSENAFYSSLTPVPGLRADPTSGRVRCDRAQRASLSEVTLSVFPGRIAFENSLLATVARAFYIANPALVPAGFSGNLSDLPLPSVFERRLHVGVHNGHRFVAPPAIFTLNPLDQDDGETGSGDAALAREHQLTVPGTVELERYLASSPDDSRFALVFAVEYRLMVGTLEQGVERSLLGEVAQTLGLAEADPKQRELGIEKGLVVGWGYWMPGSADVTNNSRNGEFANQVSLMTHSGPMPYRSAVFAAPTVDPAAEALASVGPATEAERLALAESQAQATLLVLAFKFREGPPASAPASPVRVVERVAVAAEPAPPPEKRDAAIATSPPPPVPAEAPDTEFVAPELPEPEPAELRVAVQPLDGRAERSRLALAGFEPFLDANGRKCTVLDDGRRTVDLSLELGDVNKRNDVRVRFGAVSLWSPVHFAGTGAAGQAGAPPVMPTAVYFTLQFYNMPVYTTGPMHLYTGALPLRTRQAQRYVDGSDSTPPSWPAILWAADGQSLRPDLRVPPGATVGFSCDLLEEVTSFPNLTQHTGYRVPFLRHACKASLTVDMWDAASLQCLATARVPLHHLLRQGLAGTAWHGVADLLPSDVALDSVAAPGSTPAEPIGRLYLTLANIGRRSALPDSLLAAAPAAPIVANFRDDIRGRGLTKVTIPHLADVNAELRALLVEMQHRGVAANSAEGGLSSDPRTRRFQKFAAALETPHAHRLDTDDAIGDEASASQTSFQQVGESASRPAVGGLVGVASGYKLQREAHHRELQSVSIFRERLRRTHVGAALASAISSTVQLEPAFGEACYFEYVLVNPYAHDHAFTIDFDCPDLRLVTETKEWRHFRAMHGIVEGVEDKGTVAPRAGAQAQHEVFLYANESMAVPFVYQTYAWGAAAASTTPVAFLNKNQQPVALLHVAVNPRTAPVSRVFRFFKGLDDPLRRTARVVFDDNVRIVPPGADGAAAAGAASGRKWLRTCEQNVAYGLRDIAGAANVKELSLKIGPELLPRTISVPRPRVSRGGAEADAEMGAAAAEHPPATDDGAFALALAVYDDPFYASVSEVWLVNVHNSVRVELNAVLGQPAVTQVVVRGGSRAQRVRCYASVPPEALTISPPGAFELSPHALNQVSLTVSPMLREQLCAFSVNVVDTDTHDLITSWLLRVRVAAPTATKTFSLNLALARAASKRVSYSNSYAAPRTFGVSTSRPDLIALRESSLRLQPRQSAYIHFKFLPVAAAQRTQAYVFVVDEEGQMEECLLIQLAYQ